MTEGPQHEPAAPGVQTRRAVAVLVIVVAVVVAVIAAGLVLARLRTPGPTPPLVSDGFERYRPGFESAMAKAGVEATFPAGPVDLSTVEPLGTHRFEATFTADEITALLNVHRASGRFQDQDISLREATVAFPASGTGLLSGTAVIGGSTVSAEISGPVRFAEGQIVAAAPTDVRVEGFDVPREQAEQATRLVVAYLNRYLESAPGLEVLSAEIVDAGVTVSGVAPDRIEYRASVSP